MRFYELLQDVPGKALYYTARCIPVQGGFIVVSEDFDMSENLVRQHPGSLPDKLHAYPIFSTWEKADYFFHFEISRRVLASSAGDKLPIPVDLTEDLQGSEWVSARLILPYVHPEVEFVSREEYLKFLEDASA